MKIKIQFRKISKIKKVYKKFKTIIKIYYKTLKICHNI